VVRLIMGKTLVLMAFMSIGSIASAQSCSVCTIDTLCDSIPAQPKLCPAILPTDTAQQYYEADVTFYMPQQFDITVPISATVDLTKIEVVGLSGLPAGMSWTSNNYNGIDTLNFYPPENPPLSERGCAKICGTPLLPGNYVITVSVLAYVDVASQSVVQAESFDVPLTIVANPSGNSVFTMSANQSCDSITTTFAPILESGGSPLYTYSWDFGDSTTSNQEFPPDHTYTTPGDYVVSMTMNIYEYLLTDVSVVSNTGWCGDVEELLCCCSNPDLYFYYTDSLSAMQSITVDDDKSPSWSSLNQVVSGSWFKMEFWDEDLVSAYDYLGTDSIPFTTAGTYSISTSDVIGNATIIQQLDTTYIDTDTIHVYAKPLADTITYLLNDSVCGGDSVTLTTGGGAFYQWYIDTNLIVGAMDSVYVTYETGAYWATVTGIEGCEAVTNVQNVTVIPYPGLLSFYYDQNDLITFSTEPNLQWYMDGVLIPGATGTVYTITQDGDYFLTSTNVLGCSNSSDTIFVSYTEPVGISNGQPLMSSLRIYPNPSSGSFTVKLGTFGSQEISISVSDLVGRTVYSRDFGSVNGLFAHNVEMGWVSAGVYTINVEINNYTFHRKIVVN